MAFPVPLPLPLPALSQIRQETVSRLSAMGVFRNVYDARLPQMKRELLPAVRVYTSASSQGLSINIPEFRTTASLMIQIICEDSNDPSLAELVDRYCDIVKYRLLGDGDWLQLFERVTNIESEFDRTVEGEWRLTTATLVFSIQYTEAWEPYVPDWLQTVEIKVDVIDPAADPNTGPPGTPPNVDGGYPGGYPGPDGRIEVDARVLNPTPPEGWEPPTPPTTPPARDKRS
jgi:hypothetical protein